jgi:hypothetical protein
MVEIATKEPSCTRASRSKVPLTVYVDTGEVTNYDEICAGVLQIATSETVDFYRA